MLNVVVTFCTMLILVLPTIEGPSSPTPLYYMKIFVALPSQCQATMNKIQANGEFGGS
jgi:hypothetical protein